MNSYLPTKLDSLEEINVFLSAYSLPRLKQEEIDNLKKPNTSKEIDFVNKLKKKKKDFQPTRVQELMASQGKSTKHMKN